MSREFAVIGLNFFTVCVFIFVYLTTRSSAEDLLSQHETQWGGQAQLPRLLIKTLNDAKAQNRNDADFTESERIRGVDIDI